MFCCAGFKTHIESAGQRGISILVKRDSSGLAFELQTSAMVLVSFKTEAFGG